MYHKDYLKEKYTVTEIAKQLGRPRRTIEGEIARGTVYLQSNDLTYRKVYYVDVAQRKYVKNGKNKGPQLKIVNDHKLARYIESKIINEKYTSDVVIVQIKAKGRSLRQVSVREHYITTLTEEMSF